MDMRDFICPKCGNEWSQEAGENGLCDGYGLPPCPVCGTNGSPPDDFGDWVCVSCNYGWPVYGNGGLKFGCVPACPKCGGLARKA